jgi:serine/threonine-protein kinase
MSPEQAAGSGVDHRGDIYSFGIILYELASGRVPFDADNFMGILTQHIYKSPVPIRALVPSPEGVPPGLEAIILKCLSKRPELRYQSMDLLLSDLHSLKRGAVPEAVPEMMTRSDSLNVPPDYFQPSAAIPAASASSAAAGRRLRLGAIVGAAAVLVTIGLVSVSQSPRSGRDTDSSRAEDAMAQSEIAGQAARRTEVVLAIEPLDARVFRGSEDLGQSPVIVALQAGEHAELSIQREGYEPQTIVLDGTEKKLSVKLASEAPAKPKPSGTPTRGKRSRSKPAGAPTKPNIGSPEIINPWG